MQKQKVQEQGNTSSSERRSDDMDFGAKEKLLTSFFKIIIFLVTSKLGPSEDSA